jgi:osmoprotectant transport system substrate-binding protein
MIADRKRTIAFLLVFVISPVACSLRPPQKIIVVASKNFPEQILLGEIAAQLIEGHYGTKVTVCRRLNLGDTLRVHHALLAKQVDLYPEYTGTAFTTILNHSWNQSEDSLVLEEVQKEYRETMQIEWLDPLGFSNKWGMVVRSDDVPSGPSKDRYNLSTASERKDKKYRLIVGAEFLERPDGYTSLVAAYPFRWEGAPKSVASLLNFYHQLDDDKGGDDTNGRIMGMIAGGVTDAKATTKRSEVLCDDKNAFPPYQACFVVRAEILERVPGLRHILETLKSRICLDEMHEMNVRVDKCRGIKEDEGGKKEITSNTQNKVVICAAQEAEAFLKRLGDASSAPPPCSVANEKTDNCHVQ